jgi:FkbM family methyltransferase
LPLQAEHLIKTGEPHIQCELDAILSIINRLPSGSIAIDAGANAGLVAIPIAKTLANRSGTVHAFEPQRLIYYSLCGSVALNDIENLFVYNKALGAAIEKVEVAPLDYGKVQDFGTFSLSEQSAHASEQVDVVTIDSLNLPRLDFLKIDVEGMEIDVLMGGIRTIQQFVPWCWIEYWKIGIPAIKAALSGFDYAYYRTDDLNVLCAPRSQMQHLGISVEAPEV